jgi:hypothetical protein
MPQLDLNAYPTQLFWLTLLLTLSYWALHLIAIPSILITLRLRERSLRLINITSKKFLERLQLINNKYYTFVQVRIKKIISFFTRVQKVITFFLQTQQANINLYVTNVLSVMNHALVTRAVTRARLRTKRRRFGYKTKMPIWFWTQIPKTINKLPIIRPAAHLYYTAEKIRNKTLFNYTDYQKDSWLTFITKKFNTIFHLAMPFAPAIHPYDDFILSIAFMSVFTFVLTKYSATLMALLTNPYIDDIRKKFVHALSDVSLSGIRVKQIVLRYINLVNDIRDTYQISIKNFTGQHKYPVKFFIPEETKVSTDGKIKL